MLKQLALVFIGGGLGSMSRFAVGKLIEKVSGSFSLGTFTANVIGCLLIGVFLGFLYKQSQPGYWSLLLVTGFCGGFTTFSSFANENVLLLKEGLLFTFLLYAGGSLLLGLLAVAAGLWIAQQLLG